MDLQTEIDIFIDNEFQSSFDFSDSKIFTKLRESEKIEFKKSFNKTKEGINSQYIKTIAGFANNNGGLMIFGIDPDTFELLGIKSEYENFDNRYVSTSISNSIDGNIEAFFQTKSYQNILIGFLLVRKAKIKPIILTQFIESGCVEGDIIYRYPGQTKKINAGDLRRIIHEEITNSTNKFINKINQIATIGIHNSAILDTITGNIEKGDSNVKLILEPELLNSLNLISEANIVQNDGAPAYMIRGTIHTENSNFIEKEVPKNITSNDIYESFLNDKCNFVKEYIKSILYQSSYYYPIYFFISKSNENKLAIIDFIEQIIDTDIKKSTKENLLNKLKKSNSDQPLPLGNILINIRKNENYSLEKLDENIIEIKELNKIKGNREASIKRSIFFDELLLFSIFTDDIIKKNIKEVVQAISHLKPEFINENKNYIFDLVKKILYHFNSSSEISDPIKSEFKKMLCILDHAIYGTLIDLK